MFDYSHLESKALVCYLLQHVNLTEEEILLIDALFEKRRFKKKVQIYKEGDIHRHNCFVVNGSLRLFYIDDRFKEHNVQFAFENWWIGDLGSFIKNEPSKMYLETLENTIVLQTTLEQQEELLDSIPVLNSLFRKKYRAALVSAQEKMLHGISRDAKTRYMEFLKLYPTFCTRLPDHHIASYIGVTPEFFSRMKREVIRQNLNLD